MSLNKIEFKGLLKEALIEVLSEKREMFYDFFLEVLEDIAMYSAIEEGEKTEKIKRDDILKILK